MLSNSSASITFHSAPHSTHNGKLCDICYTPLCEPSNIGSSLFPKIAYHEISTTNKEEPIIYHEFHYSCLARWFNAQQRVADTPNCPSNCPLCNRSISNYVVTPTGFALPQSGSGSIVLLLNRTGLKLLTATAMVAGAVAKTTGNIPIASAIAIAMVTGAIATEVAAVKATATRTAIARATATRVADECVVTWNAATRTTTEAKTAIELAQVAANAAKIAIVTEETKTAKANAASIMLDSALKKQDLLDAAMLLGELKITPKREKILDAAAEKTERAGKTLSTEIEEVTTATAARKTATAAVAEAAEKAAVKLEEAGAAEKRSKEAEVAQIIASSGTIEVKREVAIAIEARVAAAKKAAVALVAGAVIAIMPGLTTSMKLLR